MYGPAIFSLLCLAIYVNCATIPNAEKNVCTTPICSKESTNLLNYMDQTVDPCVDFFHFACGKYLREKVLPEHLSVDDPLSNLGAKLRKQIRDTLLEEKETQSSEANAFKLAKDFLNICMDVKTLNAAGIKPMVELLDKYGGWPVTKAENEWNEDGWDWLKVEQQISNDGFDELILDFSIQPDEKNNSKQAVVIDPPTFGLSKKFLQQGLSNDKVKNYYSFMVDLAVLFGADQSVAKEEMKKVLEFETKLASSSLSAEDRRNPSITSNFYTMESLQSTFPLLNWHDYINWNLKNTTSLNDDDMITVPDVKYLHELTKVLNETSKKTIANFIGVRLAIFSSDLLNDTLYQRQQQYKNEASGARASAPRSAKCIKKTTEFLPISTAAIYIHKYFDKNSKDAADEMAKNIKNEFIEMLNKTPWMDKITLEKAIEKANAMILIMGYPEELADVAKLDEYYQGLVLQPNSLLHSVLNIKNFEKDKKIRDFHKPILRNDWRDIAPQVTEVDAFNYPWKNLVLVTAGTLQENFFKANRPSYMNYGSIGYAIGHEITHGFDDQGRQMDQYGNVNSWWDETTSKDFDSRAKCFIDKYSKYEHPNAALNLTVNGKITLGENIADVGGLKAAYGAYQTFVEQNGPESTLPNLNYTPNQLFWISGANVWCGKSREEHDVEHYTNDPHAPFQYRVNGAFSSLSQFANDFKCPPNTEMNPADKCEIW